MIDKLDAALRFNREALNLRAERQEVLAANIAHADTPNYKARELPFKEMLNEAIGGVVEPARSMTVTNARHMDAAPQGSVESALQYRVPLMPAIDGNTVDVHVEQAAFAENALQFQASLRFLDNRFKGLISAIRGD